MAFGKPPVKPKPQVNTYSGANGALAAATKVGVLRSASKSRNQSVTSQQTSGDLDQLLYQRSGGSNSGRAHTSEIDRRMTPFDRGIGLLLHPQDQAKSPSFIAATLAASRSVTPNHTGQNQHISTVLQNPSSSRRRRSPGSIRSVSSKSSLDQELDTTPIPPTTSLIGMFERNAASRDIQQSIPQKSVTTASRTITKTPIAKPALPEARTPSPRSEKRQRPEIKSPKPTRSPSLVSKAFEVPVILSKPQNLPKITNTISTETGEPPKQPQIISRSSISASKPLPIPSKSRPQIMGDYDGASSDDSFVSASEYKPSLRASINDQKRQLSSSSTPSLSSTAAVDSLANAIIASSLASSRAASPSRASFLSAPPPPPSRRHHFFHNSSSEISRTPSPGKPVELRTTMRKPKEEDEDEWERKRRGRRNLMKKHPNKHHEGDRKRWRNEVTERERKRYEAVWASNKGLYTASGFENEVSNLVVRDIYSRSRLDEDVLEEVYALVDRRENGLLQKEEFVVGLWLIDQRLKGRKLPIRVTESVWRSVGIMRGIKVKKAGK
jgi:hypothetical protein